MKPALAETGRVQRDRRAIVRVLDVCLSSFNSMVYGFDSIILVHK
jgi:hypothetical protein